MKLRWNSALGAVSNVYGVLGFASAVIGTILGWAKVTRALTAGWPFVIQVAFYVALFVFIFVIVVAVTREMRLLWRYRTRNTLGVAEANVARDERVERVNDEQWLVIETLVRDDLANMRSRVENAEHSRHQTRLDNDVLHDRFSKAEARSIELGRERDAAVATAKKAEAEAEKARASLSALTHLREEEQPLQNWATEQIANARSHVSDHIEIVDYKFHLNELNEDVSAGFHITVLLRYWGILPAVIGEADGEYRRFLYFHGRRMGQKASIGRAVMYRGQREWIAVTQLLEGDREAVRKDWEAGQLVVDGSRLGLSIRCDDPSGGEPIVGSMTLGEMTWPKPAK